MIDGHSQDVCDGRKRAGTDPVGPVLIFVDLLIRKTQLFRQIIERHTDTPTRLADEQSNAAISVTDLAG